MWYIDCPNIDLWIIDCPINILEVALISQPLSIN